MVVSDGQAPHGPSSFARHATSSFERQMRPSRRKAASILVRKERGILVRCAFGLGEPVDGRRTRAEREVREPAVERVACAGARVPAGGVAFGRAKLVERFRVTAMIVVANAHP